MSFPVMPDIEPLTPRIETITENGRHTNLYEFDAWSESTDDGATAVCTAGGLLRNSDGRPCGIGYTLTHRFERSRLVKDMGILHHTSDDTVRIVEPILLDPETHIEPIDAHTLRIEKPARQITLHVDGATLRIDSLNAPKYKQVYPSLVALPVVIDIPVSKPQRRERVTITYEVK